MGKHVGRKKRNLLINPEFQLVFLAFLVLLSSLIIGCVFCANYYFFWKFEKYAEAMRFPPEHVFYSFIHQQESVMAGIFALVSAAIFLLVTLCGMVFSHRIAGPLWRLTQHFKESAESRRYGPVHFRKGDFFQEISAAYNAHIPRAVGADAVKRDSDVA